MNEAVALWEEVAQNPSHPDQEKAQHNLSIAWEVLQKPEKALQYHRPGFASPPDRLESLKLQTALRKMPASPPNLLPSLPGPLAVLPLENETPDLEAPKQVRKEILQALRQSGYALKSPEEIDSQLQEEGFTDPGQLRALSLRRLGKLLNARWILKGTVEESPSPSMARTRLRISRAALLVKVTASISSAGTPSRTRW